MTAEQRAVILSFVGKSYEEYSCIELVRACIFLLHSTKIPADFYAALPYFETVTEGEEPKAGDVIAIKTHRFLVTHCGLYLGDHEFLHSIEDVGACVGNTERRPWKDKIAGYLRFKGQ